MKFRDVGLALRKRWWMIAAILLLALLVAAVITKVQSPVYKVEIAVSATAPINPTTKLPDALTQTSYVALMPSIANFTEGLGVAEAVSKRLSQEGIEISPEELLKKVSAVPEANSTSVRLTFTDGSPTRVADIANAWGEVLVLKTLRSEANEYYDESFKTLLLNGSMVFTNRAVPPPKPTQPKPAAYLGLGVFMGLLLGIGLAVIIEFFDPHFRSPTEAEQLLGLPVLGIIPRQKGDRSTKLLPFFGEGSPVWEAYSELRSGIILTRKGDPPRSILAVPAIPFEAGPAVAANLAASIAYTERDTLLVDCDLREGALSRLLEAVDRPGLAEALKGDGNLRANIRATGIPNLSFLSAGERCENSTDLLSLASFSEGLRELEEIYDQVVLYAPPLVGSMDGAVVAAQAQACLVVIDAGLCTRRVAGEAMHNLRLLGVVPTGVALASVKARGGERPKSERAKEVAHPAPPGETRRIPVKERHPAPLKPAPGQGAAHRRKEHRVPTAAREAGEERPVSASAIRLAQRGEEPGAPREKVLEEFRRLGETGAPIPRNWLRALNSENAEVRETATLAITTYYRAFLRRYRIGKEDTERITGSIIRMMRREGEFANLSEAEARNRLQEMLLAAGASISRGEAPGKPPTGERGSSLMRTEESPGEPKHKEKRRFRLQREAKLPPGEPEGEGRLEGGGEKDAEEEVDWE
ncbi:MAG: Wzz/FepE/Etk N-terminal domain-containing protein [Actinomycetota bacterium]